MTVLVDSVNHKVSPFYLDDRASLIFRSISALTSGLLVGGKSRRMSSRICAAYFWMCSGPLNIGSTSTEYAKHDALL